MRNLFEKMGGGLRVETWKCKSQKKTRKNEESECNHLYCVNVISKEAQPSGRRLKLVTSWARLVLVYKIVSFLLFFTYHRGLYFKMIKNQLVQHPNSTWYHFMSCCQSPRAQNLMGFKVFLAFLWTRRFGSWGSSDVEKLGWINSLSSFARKGGLLMKQTLIKYAYQVWDTWRYTQLGDTFHTLRNGITTLYLLGYKRLKSFCHS